MAKFLLIGPSGIGKSTALEVLNNYDNVETFDLDSLLEKESGMGLTEYAAKIGWEGFFEKSVEIIKSLESKKNVVIAVGVQSIEHHAGHKWFLNQETITLTGDPNVIYARSNRELYHPTFKYYDNTEFSGFRLNLYNKTKYKIDVTNLTSQEVGESIINIINA